MKTRTLTALVPALLLALAPVAAVPAMAQGAGAPPPASGGMTGQQPGSAAAIPEAKIDSYAEAALEINQIRTKYEPQIRGAETPEKAADAHRVANQEMIQAVEQKGLSVEEYNSITAAAEADPDLSQRIVAMINEKR